MEFLTLVGIMLMIFIIMLGFSLFRKAEVSETDSYLDSSSECMKISNIINEVFAGGEGTEVQLKTSHYISLQDSGTISVDNLALCNFYAKSYLYSNLTGSLSIKNYDGNVLIQNV